MSFFSLFRIQVVHFSIVRFKEKFHCFQLKNVHYSASKQDDSPGINALLSVSDGVAPSIFFLERWKRRILWENNWMEEVKISSQSWHFCRGTQLKKLLLPVSTLSWCVNIFVSRQGKGEEGRNESKENYKEYCWCYKQFWYFLKTWLLNSSNCCKIVFNTMVSEHC